MNRGKVALAVSMLGGCGYPSSLDGFAEVDNWKCGKYEVASEIANISHQKVCRDIELAETMIDEGNKTQYSIATTWGQWRIRIWNRQVLACDQKFLGACVHFMKGAEEEDNLGPVVSLNNGGELLLHEFLHGIEPFGNPDHKDWGNRGWSYLDWTYRRVMERL